jgi:plastocyanin
MTTRDDDNIVRTSPARMAKGIVFVIVPIIVLGYFTVTYWHEMAKYPPPVSAPKPKPATTAATPTAASSSSTGPALSIPSGASTQGNPSFDPATLTVKKGDTITVTNDDNVPHTVTSGSGPEDPNSGKAFDTSIINVAANAKIDTSKLAPGDYPFHCTVHPFMKGDLKIS